MLEVIKYVLTIFSYNSFCNLLQSTENIVKFAVTSDISTILITHKVRVWFTDNRFECHMKINYNLHIIQNYMNKFKLYIKDIVFELATKTT